MKPKTKKCYVAGALSAEHAVGYVSNLHNMIIHSEKVRKMGYAVFVPGIDFLLGVVHGDWGYDDYFDNSQPWLAVSECVYVTPNWENSPGTKREIALCNSLNIPVFYDVFSMKGFILEKPVIICIVGESGSGKSTVADYICDKYGYGLIESRTTRKPRYEGESGHTFVTDEEFDSYDERDMLAFTDFGGNRYCCLRKDTHDKSVYVIDDDGLVYLLQHFSMDYHIVSLRLHRPEEYRINSVGDDRVQRDRGRFTLNHFDYHIYNQASLEELFVDTDYFMRGM